MPEPDGQFIIKKSKSTSFKIKQYMFCKNRTNIQKKTVRLGTVFGKLHIQLKPNLLSTQQQSRSFQIILINMDIAKVYCDWF